MQQFYFNAATKIKGMGIAKETITATTIISHYSFLTTCDK